MKNSKPTFEFDGRDFSTREEFFEVIGGVLIPNVARDRNLDAFGDVLCGGFGTPLEGFVLRRKNSEISRVRLRYEEKIRQLERRLVNCHPANHEIVREQWLQAKNHQRTTVFDWLVGIIQEQRAYANDTYDGIDLVLD